jgi:hypothetical protein
MPAAQTSMIVHNGDVTAFSIPSFSDAEVPTGAINGVNATYTLKNPPNPVTALQVFYNGVLDTNYSLNSSTITMSFVPQTGDTLVAYYRF